MHTQKKNQELSKQGLGEIGSLWAAKQLMDAEGVKSEKQDKKQQVIDERKKVASLSSVPTGGDEPKRTSYHNLSPAQLAEQIIQDENLR